MKVLSHLTALLVFIFSTNLHAKAIDESKSDLFYTNGIMMKLPEKEILEDQKDEITPLLISNSKNIDYLGDVKISYNVSQGFIDDLVESWDQKNRQ